MRAVGSKDDDLSAPLNEIALIVVVDILSDATACTAEFPFVPAARCAALGTEPVTVYFWLEQLISEFNGQGVTNSVTQGQFMRRLLHGPLRTELDTRISQMPEIAQAIRDQVATLDHHYAVALASCYNPDDTLLCHRAATNPRRHTNEPLYQAMARAEQAFRAAAALGCALPPPTQFWAVYA
jgi:hypothetical protein